MFKTKRDVDRHVTHILNRIRDEKERHARGFQFAKLYYDVADYESSKKYVQAFISVRQTSPQAHKLLGQVHEALRDKAKAIECYKRSLDLEPEQQEIVLKVCELYSDPSVQVSADNAKFWIEKAEKLSADDHRVFRLKERVIDKNGDKDGEELEQLIRSELLRNPGDVQLHIKLLKLYLESRHVERAYEHATMTERTPVFSTSADWYECLSDVYQVYKEQNGGQENQTFYQNKLFALANLAQLRIKADDRDMVGSMKALHQFDQDLYEASGVRKQSSEWENFLTEMKGQLFYLTALLLLKRALKGQVVWRDASTFGSICFLLSDSLPVVDLKSSWFRQAGQDKARFYTRLHLTGCDRLSQGGHMIYALLSKQPDKDWARKLRQKLCTPQGRENLYNIAFSSAELQRKKSTSYLLQSDVYTATSLDVPAKLQLTKYDSMAYTLHRDDLRHLVWLALQYHTLKEDIQPDYEQLFGCQLFPDMKYSVPDLASGDPGSLCQLDVQVFLYACVRWACIQQRDQRRNLHAIPDKPDLLPACLASGACSPQQWDWWSAVYKMENSASREKLAKVWGVVMRGLETVRLVLPHSLPLALIVHIARTLDTRAKEIESLDAEGIVTPKLLAMRGRASFYWQAASDVLHRMERNQSIKLPKELLFPLETSTDKEFSKDVRDQVKFAMATVAMREERFEEALKGFEGLYSPSAAYYSGLIYRNLAETIDDNGNASGGGASNSQQVALLTKGKTSLYQTLDRLETEPDEELKESARRDLDDVVCKLIALESGGALVDSISSPPRSYSAAESETDDDDGVEPVKHLSPRTPVLATPSRSREQMRVSPTRLDVQLKALEQTNSATSSRLSTIEETVRTQEKLIQELFSQLREYRDENNSLRGQLQTVQESVQNVATLSMAARQPAVPQQYPGTPAAAHQRSLMNAMNASFGAAAGYDYGMPGQGMPGQGMPGQGLPAHMAQYGGYPTGSPRPTSAYGQPPNIEDEFANIDGQFYVPDEDDDYSNIPDQSLIQEWPFGNKPGLEGKSTITYSPQHQAGRGMPQPQGTPQGVFANVFRGQSIQYGGYQPGQVPAQQVPQLPGPGFFSQPSQQPIPAGMQTQAGRFPGQPQQIGMQTKPGTIPAAALSPAMQQQQQPQQPPQPRNPTPTVSVSKPAVSTPMMPPNAVASPASKPMLKPGSVGVPPPASKDQAGSAVSQPGAVSAPTSAPSAAAPKPSMFPAGSSPASSGQATMPGAAASMLSQLAAKHQENTSTAQTASPAAAPATTPQKTILGGFSFTSTPKINEPKAEKPKEEVKPTATADAPKPFSGFSFTTPTQSPAKPPTNQTTSTGSPGVFGQMSTPTFGSLAAGGQTAVGFGAAAGSGAGDFKGFAGAGQSMFTKAPSPRRHNTSTGSDDHVDEYEPNVDFKPVVPLPDLVEVKTGEEDEEKMFGERAKLFRYDTESKQWKERGIGEIKILRHKTTNLHRILMRREQVLKLCANHKITKDLKLAPMATSEKAWVWTAADFSEGEVKTEKLAVRFKNQDIAVNFKKAVEACQETMKEEDAKVDEKKTEKKEEKKAEKEGKKVGKKEEKKEPSGKTSSLASLFKQKAGSWTCTGCYVPNSADILQCPCCNTMKPGATKEDLPKKETPANTGSSGSSGFTFGSQQPIQTNPSGGFSLAPKPADSTSSQPQAGGFKFGSQPSDAAATSAPQTGGFMFGSSATTAASTAASASLFGKPAASTSAPSSALSTFKFGDQGTSSEAPKETASTSGSGFNLPEPCKPTSGFTFGGADKKTTEDSPAATSAGFNVNKDASKYTFGETSKPVEEKTKEKQTPDVSDSLLAKYLSAPDTKIEEVSSTTDESKAKVQDTPGFGAAPASKFTFGQPAGGSSPFTFGSPSMPAFSIGSTSGMDEPEPEEHGKKPTTPVQPTEGFKFSMTPKAEPDKSQPAAKLGGGFNFSLNMTPGMPSKTSPQKSGLTSPKSPDVTDDGYYVNKEEDDIHFEPIIELPDKVEVKTGEEDEEVIFSHRAKLFRFTKAEWKERGLGDVKVLFCPDTNKARILMRREQILKLCCNHYVTPELKLRPMPNTEGKALIWYAMDFSDGEAKNEQFSIKFKTADIANQFQKAIEEAKERVASDKPVSSTAPGVETISAVSSPGKPDVVKAVKQEKETSDDVIVVKEETATPDEIARARELMLPDHFFLYRLKPACPGCRGCKDEEDTRKSSDQADEAADEENAYNNNSEDVNDEEYEDVETETDDEDEDDDDDDDDDDDEETDEEPGVDTQGETSRASGSQLLATLLSTDEDSTTQAGIFAGGFTSPNAAPAPAKSESGSFVFGGGSEEGMSFSSLASTSTAFQRDENKPFNWHGAGQQLFGAAKPRGEGSGDEDGVEQGEEPHFEPIVPLPELIDVKTGEEDETKEFAQRARLYRFDATKNEWKEKGVGEMKILKHNETGKYRLLLRREQVHKLACNHLLTPDLNLQPMNTSEVAWCWVAQDYSENEPKVEKLAVRFKTIELAQSFKSKVDEIQDLLREQGS